MPLFQSIAQRLPFTEARASFKAGAVENAAAADLEDQWISSMLLGAGSSSGCSVNAKSAMGVSTVYACIDVLASSVGSLPVHVHKRLPNNGSEIDSDHRLYDLLHCAPNEEMTSVDFRQAMQSNLSLHKNAFAQILKNIDGAVVGIFPLENADVTPRRDRATRELYYEVRNGKGSRSLPSDEVLHLRGASFNGVVAPDMLHTVRNVVGLAIALDQNAASFFKNGSFPGGFLKHPGQLSPEAAKRMQAAFAQSTGGNNAHRLKVLEEGLEYIAGRAPNNESQFDESRDRQAKEVARLYRVPGHKVGIIGNQPRANVEQENLSYVSDTLLPILVTWEQAMDQKLLTPEERKTHYIQFNIDGLLRGSLKERYAAYALGRQWGFLSVNEIRAKESLNGIGADGDVYMQPLNMTDTKQLPKPTEP